MKKRGTNDPVAIKTLDTLVKDSARNQALSVSLTNLIERNALGFPPFSTVTAYAVGDIVFYDRRLYKFTAVKTAGAWDSTKVEEFSMKEYSEVMAALALGYGICSTDTYDPAKVVTIPHFLLLENRTVTILFTTPINTDTLHNAHQHGEHHAQCLADGCQAYPHPRPEPASRCHQGRDLRDTRIRRHGMEYREPVLS